MTVQDILDSLGDYVGNYHTGTEDPNAKIRAVNRSIEYMKRRLGLPSDETIQSFYFSADQIFYPVNSDFDESIQLLYNDYSLNTTDREWNFYSYPEVLKISGQPRNPRYSFTTINGLKQLVMLGSNVRKGNVLFPFDSIDSWTAQDDASNLTVDTIQKYNGSASLAFDISNSSGTATLQKTGLSLDLKDLFENHGRIKYWAWMTDNNIDDITLKLMTDASNYYSITASLADDGTAFSEDEWIKIGFVLDDAVATNSPDSSNITEVRIEYDLGAGFTTAVDFRVDYMFTTYPDKMDLMYYSANKGTDSTGAVVKTILTTSSDIVYIGSYFADYIGLIARRAALEIWPQLRGDKEWYAAYTAEFNDMMRVWGRIYPRKRTMNQAMRHRIIRS